MMQAEDGSSDLDDDDFLGGLSPEDESTPLNLSRGKSLLVRPAEQSPSNLVASSGGSGKRKRAQDIQVPESPSASEMVEDTPNATPIPHERSIQVSEVTPQPLQFPEVFSQIMAPPDSSPHGSATAPPTVPQQVSEGKKSKDPTHVSTAALQYKLLPRRRQRRRRHRLAGEFEVPGDESDDGMHNAASGDDDELSYLPSRRSRRGGESGKPKPLGNAREKSKFNNQKHKTRAKLAPAPKPSEPQEPVTYSRSRSTGGVDKENELLLSSPSSSLLSSPPDSDADSEAETQTTRRYVSEELRAAAKKFAEVDKWQMEFEEISASETQGSPTR